MAKEGVHFRAEPKVVAEYDKIYGKCSLGIRTTFEPWITLRNMALVLLQGQFKIEEIIFIINLLKKIGYKDKDALRKTILLHDLTNNPFMIYAKDIDLPSFMKKLESLHNMEFYFLFRICHEHEYSDQTVEEYAQQFV